MSDTLTASAATGTQVSQQRVVQTAIPGPKSTERHSHRQGVVSSAFGVVLPVFVERMGGGIIVDVDGNHIIDLASGIAVTSVGASAPAVVRRVQEQVAAFTHTCFMVTEYDGYVAVCEHLNRVTPGDFAKKSALFSTGAEAIENAVKIARVATGRTAVVTFGHAYHGRTLLTMTMTAKNAPYKDGFGPFAPEVYRAPLPYPFRWGSGPERCADEAYAELEDLVLKQVGARHIAAIVIEPIQGEGGFIVPPPGFLSRVQELARAHGIVFVVDEIQTGMARTGKMFASEHEGIVPDLMTTAKGLGGGLPLAGVTGRAELMDAVHAGGLGGTYAGNPVACAASLGVLETIEAQGLVERAAAIGQRIRGHLDPLADELDIIGEVRGRGAMQAVEFVKPGSKDPAADTAAAVSAACHKEGVLTLTCGTYGNVIRMLPPLVTGDELIDDAMGVLAAACRAES